MVECVNCAKFKGCDLSSPNVNECADYTEKLTNEEYLRSCNTEQLAEFMLEHMDCIGCPASQEKCLRYYDACKEVMMEWLKQPHTPKE